MKKTMGCSNHFLPIKFSNCQCMVTKECILHAQKVGTPSPECFVLNNNRFCQTRITNKTKVFYGPTNTISKNHGISKKNIISQQIKSNNLLKLSSSSLTESCYVMLFCYAILCYTMLSDCRVQDHIYLYTREYYM